MPHEPLAPGQPHVAIVLLWYPLFTQPFIFREVESLASIMPVKVYTLYGRNLRHCSTEMRNPGVEIKSFGARSLLLVCGNMLLYACRHPRHFWRLLRRTLWHRWQSLETFGENLWAFAAAFALAPMLREDGMDFIYAPWPRGTATAAWVCSQLAGIPFAMAARGDNLEPRDPDLADKMAAATFIRANNAADQRRMEALPPARGKTVLLYNSLTLPDLRPVQDRFAHAQLRLLALGRFDITKGFDILLEACALLKKQGIPFHLTLAGGGGRAMGLGGLDHTLRRLRAELGLEEYVFMPGLISHDELPQILAEHDIFVAPCVIHASGRRDGIPNTVIEALAAAMPVISTDVNALPEVVISGETGLAVPPGDPHALANAIAEMAKNPQLAIHMGSNGAKLARDLFDPPANAKKLSQIFASAASGNEKCAA